MKPYVIGLIPMAEHPCESQEGCSRPAKWRVETDEIPGQDLCSQHFYQACRAVHRVELGYLAQDVENARASYEKEIWMNYRGGLKR
jgi:hypothetical protein